MTKNVSDYCLEVAKGIADFLNNIRIDYGIVSESDLSAVASLTVSSGDCRYIFFDIEANLIGKDIKQKRATVHKIAIDFLNPITITILSKILSKKGFQVVKH